VLKLLILVGDKSKILSQQHLLPFRIWKSLSVLRVLWNLENTKIFLERLSALEAEIPPGGLTASPYSRGVWPPEVAGLTASLCIVHSLITIKADQTAGSSNGQNVNLKVVVASVRVWLWIELLSDHQARRILPTASFLSVGYKYFSISCKIALLVIWNAYLTPESHLPSHTSFLWSIVGVWDSSTWFEWFELYGTKDSSSKHHQLITLRGCRLLDGFEEWKSWALQEDCEGGLMFLWEVLYSPHRSNVEQLLWNQGSGRFKVLISLKVKLLFVGPFCWRNVQLIEKRIKDLNPPQCGLGVIGKSPRPREENVSLSLSCLITCWLSARIVKLYSNST
jgi:hypothetical protein